ncbi:MAG: hypothetical protein LAN63_12855 [Acidobacteriia bacterium]|nr:hypothetical protein [Terriglobia bacterium]
MNPRGEYVKVATKRRWRPGVLARQAREVASVFLSTLREIFDESAYARFLARHRTTSSRAAYAAFLREHAVAKARRPKCC